MNDKKWKKQKEGFTLIELLAVIVILAVIALIATPMILGVIESAKRGAAIDSGYGIISAGEQDLILKGQTRYRYTKESNLDFKGTKPEQYLLLVSSGSGTVLRAFINGYCVTKNLGQDKVTIDDTKTTQETCLDYQTLHDLGSSLVSASAETYPFAGGTYLKGMQEGNYLWYGGNLWRIMGVDETGAVKAITEDIVGQVVSGYDNGVTNYETSYMASWLNNEFLPQLTHQEYLVDRLFCINRYDPTIDWEDEKLGKDSCDNNEATKKNKIGLLTYDELLASYTSPWQDNATYLDPTRNKRWFTSSYGPFSYTEGVIGFWINNNPAMPDFNGTPWGIRPTIYLKDFIEVISGTGSKEDPYQIEEPSSKQSLQDQASIGSYVRFGGHVYRVVDHLIAEGTKLVLDDVYPGLVLGTNFSDQLQPILTGTNEEGKSLLEWVAKGDEKEKLVDYTWYRGSVFTLRQDYRLDLENKETSFISKIGLPRWSEVTFLSSENLDTNVPYFLLSFGYKEETTAYLYWNRTGFGDTSLSHKEAYLRPSIVIKKEIPIQSGTGSKKDPFVL